MTNFRYTGNHVQDFDADGKVLMVPPGGFVELSDDDIDNGGYQDMVDSGVLISDKAPAETKTTTGGKK